MAHEYVIPYGTWSWITCTITCITEHQQIEYSNEIRESSRKALNQSKLGLCSTEKCPQTEKFNTFRILFECSARALVHGALRVLILAHVATTVLVLTIKSTSPDFLSILTLSSLSNCEKFYQVCILFHFKYPGIMALSPTTSPGMPPAPSTAVALLALSRHLRLW